MAEVKPAQIKIGELSDVKCPLCGRFFPENQLEIPGEVPAMCVRCVIDAPVMRQIASDVNNSALLDDLIANWDDAYKKALHRKLDGKGCEPQP
ncbi:MAG: hypothetical protein NWE93_04805 [Candidatus Bathyarchaeota archaeon]|nr:hypothetical protein [Candidatus Bathyarchaeota archaeon]